MIATKLFVGHKMLKRSMPPYNPGSMSDDYDEIKDWLQSVEQYEVDKIPEDVEYYDDVPSCEM